MLGNMSNEHENKFMMARINLDNKKWTSCSKFNKYDGKFVHRICDVLRLFGLFFFFLHINSSSLSKLPIIINKIIRQF